MATRSPRPSATLRSTKCVATLNGSGTPRSKAVRMLMQLSPAPAARQSPAEKIAAKWGGREPRPPVRRLREQSIGPALVDVDADGDPPIRNGDHADTDRQ